MEQSSDTSKSKCVCRFCHASRDRLCSIFNHETIDIPTIVKIVTNLVVSESDPFSKFICSTCFDTVKSIVEFREKCLESFHAAEHELLTEEELSHREGLPIEETLQLEFIKCESPGISDCTGYDQEETYSTRSESEQEHDRERLERDCNQTSGKKSRKPNQTPNVGDKMGNGSSNDVANQQTVNKPSHMPGHDGNTKELDSINQETSHKSASLPDQEGQLPSEQIDSSRYRKPNAKQSTTEVFECEVCGKKLKSKSNYTNHRKMHSRKEHNAPPKAVSENRSISEQKRVYLCNICGHNCGSSSNLGVHLRRHNGQSVCECTVCGKGFPRRSDMVMHMRKHTGEKPFTCPTCTRGFSRLDKLRIHIRTHTGEKPYKCPCGRAYAQKNDLKTHQKRNICGQNFDLEKLLAPRPTTICIKSPQRHAEPPVPAPQLQSGGLQRGLNTIPESYGTVEGVPSAGLHLNADSLVDIMFPGSWNSCMSTPHFQHHERSADGGYEGSSSYVHQSSKLIS